MFETLSKLIQENPEAINELNKIKNNFTSLENEVKNKESKLNDVISSRDKFKTFSKTTKEILGIEDGEELNDETIRTKLNQIKGTNDNNEDIKNLKNEIDSIQSQLIKSEQEKNDILNNKSKEIESIKIDFEIAKNSANLNTINKKATSVLMRELNKGITLEDGKIIYKDENGSTIRKNGVPMTLEEKIESIKEDDEFSFLFKSEVKSGSGSNFGSGGVDTQDVSDFTKRKLQRLKELG